MQAVLHDTNVWSWTPLGRERLTSAAQAANDRATSRYISPISFYEIGRKVRLGQWPAMADVLPRFREAARDQGLGFTRLDDDVCALAATLDWEQRDPSDRMLAATALIYRLPIISSDRIFDGLVTRIW